MNILIINHYAGSPKYGMEYRPYYLAKEWIKLGHHVKIVAASESHLRQAKPLTQKKITHENIEGIGYIWLKTPSYQGNGIKRVLNMLSFGKSLFFSYPYFLSGFSPDLVIASSPHPFIIRGAKRIADQYNAKLIFEVRDLWPLSLMELGNINPLHPFILFMKQEEKYAYQHSDYIVSLLSNASHYMQQQGMAKNKFCYIPNGIVVAAEQSTATLPKTIATQLVELKKQFELLICFAGSHGIANALDYLLDAAALLSGQAIGFILIGDGAEKNKLKQKVIDNKLDNVYFFDPIKKDQVPLLLNKMDVLYIGLQKQTIFQYGVSPNKLFDYMQAKKPIIQAINAANDLVEQSACGLSCEAENAQAIMQAIKQLKEMPAEKREAIGERGRQYVIKHHNYRVLAQKYLQVINSQ